MLKETRINSGHLLPWLVCAFTFYLVKRYPSPVERVLSYMGDIGMSAVKHVVLKQFHLE